MLCSPNVDFYSGIVLRALGIPLSMYTVLFAVARTVGWVSQVRIKADCLELCGAIVYTHRSSLLLERRHSVVVPCYGLLLP